VAVVEELRAHHHGHIVIDAVVPYYYARYPKPCVGGWGRRSLNVTPAGKVLPCHAAESIAGLEFWNVLERSFTDIWVNSPAFNAFRGPLLLAGRVRLLDNATLRNQLAGLERRVGAVIARLSVMRRLPLPTTTSRPPLPARSCSPRRAPGLRYRRRGRRPRKTLRGIAVEVVVGNADGDPLSERKLRCQNLSRSSIAAGAAVALASCPGPSMILPHGLAQLPEKLRSLLVA